MQSVLPHLLVSCSRRAVPSKFIIHSRAPSRPISSSSSSPFPQLILPLRQFSIHDLESILSPSPLASQIQNCLAVSKELSYPIQDSELWIWALALTKAGTKMFDQYLTAHFKRQRQRTSRNPRLADLEKGMLSSSRGLSHQRLEFMGDAVLNASAALFSSINWPQAHEGTLTIVKGHLISNHALAEVVHRQWPTLHSVSSQSVQLLSSSSPSSASSSSVSPFSVSELLSSSNNETTSIRIREMELPMPQQDVSYKALLHLAGASIKPPPSAKPLGFPIETKNVVADCLEALVGAVYAVHGFERASECAKKWIFEPVLKSYSIQELESLDSISQLQAEAVRQGLPIPEYRFEQESNTVIVSVDGVDFTSSDNTSIVRGRKAAAETALKKLQFKTTEMKQK